MKAASQFLVRMRSSHQGLGRPYKKNQPIGSVKTKRKRFCEIVLVARKVKCPIGHQSSAACGTGNCSDLYNLAAASITVCLTCRKNASPQCTAATECIPSRMSVHSSYFQQCGSKSLGKHTPNGEHALRVSPDGTRDIWGEKGDCGPTTIKVYLNN